MTEHRNPPAFFRDHGAANRPLDRIRQSCEYRHFSDAANHDDPGLLGRSLRGVVRGTLLFDEIEKAHPLVLDLFLQVLEDARITLATGEGLDLRGFYVVFTSNIGSEEAIHMENAPFASVERTVLMRVRERLRPELLGGAEDLGDARLGETMEVVGDGRFHAAELFG